ncbi:hypothetical protein [Nitrosomonas sp.]|uniref:hypothetical protein n=1 Tax=Nitrosomonas sp. TaxID=42353 RepID=UPI0025D474D2|nr:hypothetical protein [Nitrosomonas sp.]MBV6448517.1 hypothetical protein [Nitrosomonas sp.]
MNHPLDAVGLTRWASLYRAMAATAGFTPRQVDELALWECAAVLGVGWGDAASTRRGGGQDSFAARSKALIRRRLAHARGQAPPPEPVAAGDATPETMRRAYRHG